MSSSHRRARLVLRHLGLEPPLSTLFVFGRVLPGSTGGAVLMLSSLAFAIAGIGLLKVELLAD